MSDATFARPDLTTFARMVRSLREAPVAELEEGCPVELRADALQLAREVFFGADYQQRCFDQAVAAIRARVNRHGTT